MLRFPMLALFLLGVTPAVAAPFFVDAAGRPLPSERTICGKNDLLPMVDQSEEMKQLGGPIGIYRERQGGGSAMCSGTLVDKDLFLTARHCLASTHCKNVSVTFGYLQDGRAQETFACKEVVERGGSASNQDYAVLRLEGSPGAAWGYYPLSDRELDKEEQLMMIHHPSGTPMKVSLEECRVVRQNSGFIHHRCDTRGGSSGAGILTRELDKPERIRVVGVHTLGGCSSQSSSANSGPSIRSLAAKSALLRSLIR